MHLSNLLYVYLFGLHVIWMGPSVWYISRNIDLFQITTSDIFNINLWEQAAQHNSFGRIFWFFYECQYLISIIWWFIYLTWMIKQVKPTINLFISVNFWFTVSYFLTNIELFNFHIIEYHSIWHPLFHVLGDLTMQLLTFNSHLYSNNLPSSVSS